MTRWFWGTGRLLALTLVSIIFLAGTVALLSGILAWILDDDSWHSPQNLAINLAIALGIWLAFSYYHLRAASMSLPVVDCEIFLEKARQTLADMGYELLSQSQRHLLAKPGFQSYLLGGAFSIQVEGKQAKLSGPKVLVEMVRQRLRLDRYLEKDQHQLDDGKRRFAPRLLKRVEIHMMLKPNQLAAVQGNVVDLLTPDAHVVCRLELLAQSETGIQENIVDWQIREWLEQMDIEAHIQRNHVEMQVPPEAAAVG